MARDLPAAMDTTLASGGLRLIHLVSLALSQGTYRYALSPVDITFGGATYTATAGEFNEVQETTERQAPSLRLVLQNVDGVLGRLLDPRDSTGADQRGRRVTVTTITEADIADSTAKVEDTFFIDAVSLSRLAAVFVLGNPMAVGIKVPHFVTQPYFCPWAATAYRGPECGSTSLEKTCPGTLVACRQRFEPGEALRFGGFPGRAAWRRVVL